MITSIGCLKLKAVWYWTAANSNAWFSTFKLLLVFIAISSYLMI